MHDNFRLVKVKWIDSAYHGSWLSLSDIENITLNDNMVSIGFLVRETNDLVVIAANKGEHNFSSITVIPKCSVIEILDIG